MSEVGEQKDNSINGLALQLGQIIVIVCIGYFSRNLKIISDDITAISIIVAKFAMPAIFFTFASSLDISNYSMIPIVSIIITRLLMISLVGLICFTLKKKPFLSYWGLMGIFCNQSNDIALGLPVINSLWDNDTQFFGDYTIINSTTALFTTSICIAMLLIGEQQKRKDKPRSQSKQLSSLKQVSTSDYTTKSSDNDNNNNNNSNDINNNNNNDNIVDINNNLLTENLLDNYKNYGSVSELNNYKKQKKYGIKCNKKCGTFMKVTISLLKNQLLLAVILGTIFNVILKTTKQKDMPLFMKNILTSMSNTFNFLALFLIGVGLCGKIKLNSFFGKQAIFPLCMIFLKQMLMPLIARLIFTILDANFNNDKLYSNGINTKSDWENYMFLYGSLPPAVTPVVLAQSFNTLPDVISNAFMISMFITAPYIFITSLLFADHSSDLLINTNKVITTVGSVFSMTGLAILIVIILGILSVFISFPDL